MNQQQFQIVPQTTPTIGTQKKKKKPGEIKTVGQDSMTFVHVRVYKVVM